MLAALRRAAASASAQPALAVRKALRYPRWYFSALTARRLLPRTALAPAHAVAVAERFSWAGGPIAPNQVRREIEWLLTLVEAEHPRTVVEIGTLRGGTLFLWTRVAADDATVVTVDSATLGGWSPLGVLCRGFARGRQRVVPLLGADSHAPETVARVRRAIGRAPVDLLFVDGDHSYEGVRRDFELYAPLVRPGGLVVFHDVSQRPTPATEGVARFWREFRSTRETEEYVADEQPGFGIGIHRVP